MFQTFYITLDLTTPEVPATQRQLGGKKGKGARWTNPGLGKNQRAARLPEDSGFKLAKVLQIDDEDAVPLPIAGEAEAENDDEEDVQGPPQRRRRGKGKATKENPVPEEEPRATEVQILDLHSIKPLVSYDGHIFACRWSENIGTEMLFMPHEKERTLPILRTLRGDADLIAASSARITARTAHLERKGGAEPKSMAAMAKAKARMAYAQSKTKANIPRGTSSQRNAQAAFLEKLIDIKDDAGEEDYVTVHAKSRLTNNRWRKEMKALRAAERERLEQVIAERKNGAEIVKARERLKQMDEEDEDLRKVEEEKGVGAGINGINKRKRQGGAPKKDAITPLEMERAGQAGPSGFPNGLDGSMDQVGTPFTESGDGETPRSFETGMDDYQGAYGTPGVRFQGDEDGLSDQDADGEDDDMYD